jgi:hypothetical protein
MLWLMISLLCVAIVTRIQLAGRDVIEGIDIRMAVEQGAILLTGLTAALAALSTAVPGRAVMGPGLASGALRQSRHWLVGLVTMC